MQLIFLKQNSSVNSKAEWNLKVDIATGVVERKLLIRMSKHSLIKINLVSHPASEKRLGKYTQLCTKQTYVKRKLYKRYKYQCKMNAIP